MIGKVLGHYRIVAAASDRGGSSVFEAIDMRSNQGVILHYITHESIASHPDGNERLEALRRQSSVSHLNVAKVVGIGRGGEGHWVACELYQGGTLAAAMEKQAFSTREALTVAVQIAQGLAELHVHGIYGAGLNPDEILLEPSGTVKLLHPSLICPADGGRTRGESGHTDIMFLAPERIAGEPPEVSSDIFSLGVLLHHLLSGSYPFKGETVAQLLTSIAGKDPDLDAGLRGDMPGVLRGVLTRALRKDRRERYGSMREMEADLRRAADQFEPHKVLGLPAPAPFVLFILLLLATLVAAGVILWSRKPVTRHAPIADLVPAVCALTEGQLTDQS